MKSRKWTAGGYEMPEQLNSYLKIVLLFAGYFALLFPSTSFARRQISDYNITLNLDLQDSSFSAVEVIAFTRDTSHELTLDASNLDIDNIILNGKKLHFSETERTLRIELPSFSRNESGRLELFYHAKPKTGLVIHPQEVYSGFNSDSWFACDHRPGDKAKYRLTFTIPATWRVAASGDLQGSDTLPSGDLRYSFFQSVPISAYTFGFAAGLFDVTSEQAGNVTLRYLTTGYSRSEVDSIFSDTRNILAFFERVTGIQYPYSTYTQVFTRDENEQEAARFCLLSSNYGKDILADPREEWLIIHEFCHQWFGNSITCADWSDFWLNEGMTTFLTACYKQHAFGQDEYDREMFLARIRYNRIRATPKGLPIVRYNYHRASEMGGIVTYYKGALVLNYLRSIIGEKAFWRGLRSYANKYWLGSVVTADFEGEMEQSSKQNLKWFFDQWVYSADSLILNANYKVHGNVIDISLEQSGPRVYWLPMNIAIVSNGVRKSYPINFGDRYKTFSFPVLDTLNAVRIDDGSKLPISVTFSRPVPMLEYQATHEPDILGRIDAMNELASNYQQASPEAKQGIVVILNNALNSKSRMIVQVAKSLSKKILLK